MAQPRTVQDVEVKIIWLFQYQGSSLRKGFSASISKQKKLDKFMGEKP
jgi:hypothetical protein